LHGFCEYCSRIKSESTLLWCGSPRIGYSSWNYRTSSCAPYMVQSCSKLKNSFL